MLDFIVFELVIIGRHTPLHIPDEYVSQGIDTPGGLMFWTVTITEISPRKPCYDGASAVTEKALGAGSSLRTVSHLLSHQHTQTGTESHTTLKQMLFTVPGVGYLTKEYTVYKL